jgi:hypothetical protein
MGGGRRACEVGGLRPPLPPAPSSLRPHPSVRGHNQGVPSRIAPSGITDEDNSRVGEERDEGIKMTRVGRAECKNAECEQIRADCEQTHSAGLQTMR